MSSKIILGHAIGSSSVSLFGTYVPKDIKKGGLNITSKSNFWGYNTYLVIIYIRHWSRFSQLWSTSKSSRFAVYVFTCLTCHNFWGKTLYIYINIPILNIKYSKHLIKNNIVLLLHIIIRPLYTYILTNPRKSRRRFL